MLTRQQKSTFSFFDRSHVLRHPQTHSPRQGGAWFTCSNVSHPGRNDLVREVLPHAVFEVVQLVQQVGEGIARQRVPWVDAHRKHLSRQRPGQRLLPWCWGGGISRRLPDAMLDGEHMWASAAPNNGCAKSPKCRGRSHREIREDSSSRVSPREPEPLALPVLSRMHVSCPKPSMHNEVSCSYHRGSTGLTYFRVLTGPSPGGCVKLFVRINRSISLLAAAAVPPTLATRPAIMNMSILWVGKKAVSTPGPLTTKSQETLRRCASRNMGASEKSVQNV